MQRVGETEAENRALVPAWRVAANGGRLALLASSGPMREPERRGGWPLTYCSLWTAISYAVNVARRSAYCRLDP